MDKLNSLLIWNPALIYVNMLQVKCHYCNEVFVGTSLLDSHLDKHHMDRAEHACSLCERRCFTKERLRLHMKAIHQKVGSLSF